jgi:hypothetical protein
METLQLMLTIHMKVDMTDAIRSLLIFEALPIVAFMSPQTSRKKR